MSFNPPLLTAAIDKAVKNDWAPAGGLAMSTEDTLVWIAKWPIKDVIYHHGFAKALWGDRWVDRNGVDIEHRRNGQWTNELHAWQYHLQQMVVSDDPIKYLGGNM